MSNTQGQGVWQWVATGFGEMPATHAGNGFAAEAQGPSTGPAIDFPLRYPGQVHDVETGLFYNHHRYYDPYLTVGYAQADPIGLEGGWNRFAYVGGDPQSMVDWDGLQRGPARPRQGVVTPGQHILNIRGEALIREIRGYFPGFIYHQLTVPGRGFTYRDIVYLQEILNVHQRTPMCPVNGVIIETHLSKTQNINSQFILNQDQALQLGIRILGPTYRQLGKQHSGTFRSTDGWTGYRIDNGSLIGRHSPGHPHTHMEIWNPNSTNKPIVNNQIQIK